MTTACETSKHEREGGELSAMRSTALGGTRIPDRVLLAPWGQVESTNGSFVVDEESAALATAAMTEQATDTPIDYEHQTLGGRYASPNGQAPAAGWIKQLEAEPGVGLLARIEWTAQAKEMLAAKEYRYLSPVALIRKSDRKMIGLHSAALTNKPAIKGMTPIVNRASGAAIDPALSSPEDVEPLIALREELSLPTDADAEAVLLAASRRLTDLREETRRWHVAQRMAEAVRSGKLVEAQREWAESLVDREETLFDEWLRTAPVVVARGAIAPPLATSAPEQRRRTAETRARAEYRTNPLLSRLTTEAAYVANAVRDFQASTN